MRIRDSFVKFFFIKKVKGKIIIIFFFYEIGRVISENILEEVFKGEFVGILLVEGMFLRKDVEYFDLFCKKWRILYQYCVEIIIGKDEEEFRDCIIYIFECLFGIILSILEKKGINVVIFKVVKKNVYFKVKEIMDNIEFLYVFLVFRGFFEGDGLVNRVRRSIVVIQGIKNEWKIKLVLKLFFQFGIFY